MRSWAKENLAGKSVHHNALNKAISFTNTGIKEYLNQPHRHYHEKDRMVYDIQCVIRNSEYKGFANYRGKISHIFEIEIYGDRSWIIANEYPGRGIILYSISDSEKVLLGIKDK